MIPPKSDPVRFDDCQCVGETLLRLPAEERLRTVRDFCGGESRDAKHDNPGRPLGWIPKDITEVEVARENSAALFFCNRI